MNDVQPDDERRTLARWMVRFRGTLTPETVTALEEQGITKHSYDHLFEMRVPDPSATMLVRTAGQNRAVRQVEKALEGHGDFSDFEAERMP
jgi:hypothetical protein